MARRSKEDLIQYYGITRENEGGLQLTLAKDQNTPLGKPPEPPPEDEESEEDNLSRPASNSAAPDIGEGDR